MEQPFQQLCMRLLSKHEPETDMSEWGGDGGLAGRGPSYSFPHTTAAEDAHLATHILRATIRVGHIPCQSFGPLLKMGIRVCCASLGFLSWKMESHIGLGSTSGIG